MKIKLYTCPIKNVLLPKWNKGSIAPYSFAASIAWLGIGISITKRTLRENTYQYLVKYRTKCPCFICKSRMRYVAFRIKIGNFYTSLRYRKWIVVEFQGSEYSDFREYEVIGRKRVRTLDGKGFQWPKTNYNNVRSVEVGESND